MSAAAKVRKRARSAALRRLRQRRQRRGVALIMVLGAITVLTVFLVELQEETSSELSSALVERDTMRAEYLARSAVNLSRMLVATEPTIRQTVTPMLMMMGVRNPPQIPIWEFSDMVLAPFNDEASAMAFGSMAGLDTTTAKNIGLGGTGGSFTVRIVDEEAKINANAGAKPGDILGRARFGSQMIGLLGPPQYNTLFEQQDADGQYSDRASICGAVVDWSDMDEELYPCDPTNQQQSGAGAEDSFYQLIGMPYRRKNTAYDSLEELRMVRGFGDDFWATFVDPDPGDPKARVMTVWGGSTVNVNTANAQTLLALICANAVPDTQLCMDPMQQATFLAMVSMARSAIPIPIFTSAKNFTNTLEGKGKGGIGKMVWDMMGLPPIVLLSAQNLQKQVSTGSKMFSIYAEGVVAGTNKRETIARIHAVVDFRFASVPGDFVAGLAGGAQTPGGGATAPTQPATQMTPEAMAGILQSNPAGNVVYWRLE